MGRVYSKGGYFGNKGTLPDIRFDRDVGNPLITGNRKLNEELVI